MIQKDVSARVLVILVVILMSILVGISVAAMGWQKGLILAGSVLAIAGAINLFQQYQ